MDTLKIFVYLCSFQDTNICVYYHNCTQQYNSCELARTSVTFFFEPKFFLVQRTLGVGLWTSCSFCLCLDTRKSHGLIHIGSSPFSQHKRAILWDIHHILQTSIFSACVSDGQFNAHRCFLLNELRHSHGQNTCLMAKSSVGHGFLFAICEPFQRVCAGGFHFAMSYVASGDLPVGYEQWHIYRPFFMSYR